MWIEILKIIATSAITAVILGYIFNYILSRKLEERKTLLKINEHLILSLINALNTVMGELKTIVEKAKVIRGQIKEHKLSDKSINEFIRLSEKYRMTFKEYRIYLGSILPFGSSETTEPRHDPLGLSAINQIVSNAQIYMKASNAELRLKSSQKCLGAIDTLEWSYERLCSRARRILMYLNDGKDPKRIDWEKVDNDVRSFLK